jgi:hypothetical protein
MHIEDRNGVIPHGQVVMLPVWDHENSQFKSHQISSPLIEIFSCHHFGNVKFWQQKIHNILYVMWTHTVTENRTHNLCVTKQCAQPLCHWCAVLSKWVGEISLSIEATDYRSNLAKTILFESCSCFSKIPFSISVESPRIFQGLISIPAGHWVRQIDGKSSAIYLADSFCQHYSALWSAWQEDPNDPQERCAMARTSCARL